jgi:hypothetical protein
VLDVGNRRDSSNSRSGRLIRRHVISYCDYRSQGTVNSGRDKHLLLSAIGLAALVQQLETQEGIAPRAHNRLAVSI